jgi:hypothetical protein
VNPGRISKFARQDSIAGASFFRQMDRREQIERIYDEHSSSLFAFVLNLSRNEDLTREVLQEVFQKIGRRPDLLDNVRNERSFLIRLAHNQTIDLLRRRETRDRYHTALGGQNPNPFASVADPAKFLREAVSRIVGRLLRWRVIPPRKSRPCAVRGARSRHVRRSTGSAGIIRTKSITPNDCVWVL